jgi:hypothetical protein
MNHLKKDSLTRSFHLKSANVGLCNMTAAVCFSLIWSQLLNVFERSLLKRKCQEDLGLANVKKCDESGLRKREVLNLKSFKKVPLAH